MLGFNRLKLGNTIVENNAVGQTLNHRLVYFTMNTRHIFALHFVGRVHQSISQLTVIGK